jgi:uncharacterized protein (TIGR02147 family)
METQAQQQPTTKRDDYRQLLQQELMKRLARNPQYSLRAFARDLDLSPGFLSGLLGHRKGLSELRAAAIAAKLSLTDEERKLFGLLVRLETTELPDEESRIQSQIDEIHSAHLIQSALEDVQFEHFKVIGEWYHLPILELVNFKGATSAEWIAERLSLRVETVNEALDRLLRIGLLEKTATGWKQGSPHIRVPSAPSECVRAYHRSYLEAAIEAIESQPVAGRILHTAMIPIAARLIPKVEEQIHRFANEVIGTSEAAEHEQLYCLSVAFFRVDKD